MKPSWRVGSGVRWRGPVITGAVVAAIAGAALLYQGGRVMSAVFSPGRDAGASDRYTKLLADSESDIASSRKRFEGRSFFFTPPAWPPDPHKQVVRPPVTDPPPPVGPPPPPETYSGPPIMACIGDTVFFTNGNRVKVGEEKEGVKVVSTNPPWNVTLNHLKKDYSIDIFSDGGSAMFVSNLKGYSPAASSGFDAAAKAGAPGAAPPPGAGGGKPGQPPPKPAGGSRGSS